MPFEDEKYSYVVFRKREFTGLLPAEEVEREQEEKLRKELLETGTLDVDREKVRKEMRGYARDLALDAHFWPRVVSRPLKKGGHVIMDLCTPKGTIERKKITSSDGREGGYKFARQCFWGDQFPFFAH